jgi:hypothetical protein
VRRLLAVFACALAMTILVTTPAMAMYHDKITNPLLHTLADLATAVLVCAPILLLAVHRRLPAIRR